jgi:hypothetical protein
MCGYWCRYWRRWVNVGETNDRDVDVAGIEEMLVRCRCLEEAVQRTTASRMLLTGCLRLQDCAATV